MELDIYKFYNMSPDQIIPTITTLIKYLKIYIKNAKDKQNTYMNLIKEYHQFIKLRSLVGLMIIITPQSKSDIWSKAEILLSQYSNEYYEDKELYELISNDENKFYLFLIKNFKKYYNRTRELNDNINKLKSKILKGLLSIDYIEFENKQFQLTKKNYDILVKTLDLRENRKQLERHYCNKTKLVIPDFIELLLLQHKLSIEQGYNTYLESIIFNNSDIPIIKKIIDDIIFKLSSKVMNELNKIYKQKNVKLNKCDVLHHFKFNLSQSTIQNLFDLMFKKIKSIFNLTFEEVEFKKNDFLFKKFICKNSDVFTGYVFFGYVNKEKIDGCLAINLEDNFNTPANTIFLMNYTDWNTFIDFNDIETIFSEFGYIIRYLIYQSDIGLLNLENEYDTLYPFIMTFILWDSLMELYNLSDEEYQIILAKYKLSLCFTLYYDCIDCLYDHLIHNSVKLIECLQNTPGSHNLLIELYITIYKETFNNSKLLKYEINPFIIMYFINGMQGLIFSNIINRILAFSIFNYIKQNPNNIPTELFNNGVDSYRVLLKKFSNKYQNNYSDFIKYLLN